MRDEQLLPDNPFPRCLMADGAAGDPHDAATLTRWAVDHRDQVRDMLGQYGALLFRGFGLTQATQVERFANEFGGSTMEYMGGTSPRDRIEGNVYESTHMDPRFSLPLHLELSYQPVTPQLIYFACQTPPGQMGQTPLVDMARVYDTLGKAFVTPFEQRGVCVTHSLRPKRSRAISRSWKDMFETDDRQHAQDRAESVGFEVKWLDDGSMRLTTHARPTLRHPDHGRMVWCNQVHLFHLSWSWELARVGQRGIAAGLKLWEWWQRRQIRRNPATQRVRSTFGDDGPISMEQMLKIRQTLWDCSVQFDWQQGDLLLLDNLWIGHGRNPYKPPRKILLAMSDPIEMATLDQPTREAIAAG